MAKRITIESSKVKYKYPSYFGSHRSMVNILATREMNPGICPDDPDDLKPFLIIVCTDEFGNYSTLYERLDSGLADPYRWDLVHRGVNVDSHQPNSGE